MRAANWKHNINFVQKLVGSKFKKIYDLQLTLTLHKTQPEFRLSVLEIFTNYSLHV